MAEPSLLDQLIEDDDEPDVPAATPASSRSEEARGDESNPDEEATEDDGDGGDDDGGDDGGDEDAEGDQDDDMDLDLEAELEAELEDADAVPEPGTAEASEGLTPQPTPAMTAATATPGTMVPSQPGEDAGPSADGQVGEDDLDDDDEDYDVAPGGARAEAFQAGDDGEAGMSALPQEFLDRKGATKDGGGVDADASTSYGPDEKTRKQHEMGIVGQLDSLQSERYELYRRSKLKPASMKKVVEAVAGRSVNANVVTAMCGVTKMYVGEVVETARSIATRAGHHGPLWPRHIIEAHEVLQQQQQWPGPAPRRPGRLFR